MTQHSVVHIGCIVLFVHIRSLLSFYLYNQADCLRNSNKLSEDTAKANIQVSRVLPLHQFQQNSKRKKGHVTGISCWKETVSNLQVRSIKQSIVSSSYQHLAQGKVIRSTPVLAHGSKGSTQAALYIKNKHAEESRCCCTFHNNQLRIELFIAQNFTFLPTRAEKFFSPQQQTENRGSLTCYS